MHAPFGALRPADHDRANRLKAGHAALHTAGHRIIGTLSPSGECLQYRIRRDDRRDERVTTQDNLEQTNTLFGSESATLIGRTFGYG